MGPYAHLHIADATGIDGEGLRVHESDIDFAAMSDSLMQVCPNASFIGDLAGHKNRGEGFWRALDRLSLL